MHTISMLFQPTHEVWQAPQVWQAHSSRLPSQGVPHFPQSKMHTNDLNFDHLFTTKVFMCMAVTVPKTLNATKSSFQVKFFFHVPYKVQDPTPKTVEVQYEYGSD